MYFFGVFHVALRLMVERVEPLLCKHSPDLLWVKSRRLLPIMSENGCFMSQ